MFHQKIKTIIYVEGMKCNHCSKKVENALLQIDSIEKVKINLEKKEVICFSKEEISIDKIKNKIQEIGYEVLE